VSWARPVAALTLLGCLGLTSCTQAPPSAPPPTPSTPSSPTSPTAVTSASASASAPATESEIPEPTTTNTLPPPPAPTSPAPSTAGSLTERSLPVPAGWRKATLKGSDEEGFEGNGTWVHARDPRYAAHDVITIGCAAVTRDDYTDPVAALEGNYAKGASTPGVGLVLDFGEPAAAGAFFDLYRQQVRACRNADGPLRTKVLTEDGGLIDQRTYSDSTWTEVAKQTGATVTLIILSDPGHRITRAAAERILGQIG